MAKAKKKFIYISLCKKENFLGKKLRKYEQLSIEAEIC